MIRLASLTGVSVLTLLPSFVGMILSLRVFDLAHSYLVSIVTYALVRAVAIFVVVPIATPLLQRITPR
jgi:hypothetical protein